MQPTLRGHRREDKTASRPESAEGYRASDVPTPKATRFRLDGYGGPCSHCASVHQYALTSIAMRASMFTVIGMRVHSDRLRGAWRLAGCRLAIPVSTGSWHKWPDLDGLCRDRHRADAHAELRRLCELVVWGDSWETPPCSVTIWRTLSPRQMDTCLSQRGSASARLISAAATC